MGLRLWDYYCSDLDRCGYVEQDRLVQYEEQDAQACPECRGVLVRLPAVTKSWIVDPDRTRRQLQERSLRHTRNMMKKGLDPRQNETQRNTSEEWRTKTRSKVTRKGMVAEHQNDHKKWAEDNKAMGLDDAGQSAPLRDFNPASKIVPGR